MLGHKSLNKLKETKIISSIFSNHSETGNIKQEKMEIHKYVKTKQYTAEQPMSQGINQNLS